MVATQSYALAPGEDSDLGELSGVPASDVPKDERGSLGLTARTARWATRPVAEGEAAADAPPAGLAADVDYLWIADVDRDGPAAKAGLGRGDRVTAINGAAIELVGAEVGRQMLQSRRLRVGDQVALEYERDGSRQTATFAAVAGDGA
jgi:S1-C subfamily serine protease